MAARAEALPRHVDAAAASARLSAWPIHLPPPAGGMRAIEAGLGRLVGAPRVVDREAGVVVADREAGPARRATTDVLGQFALIAQRWG